MKHLGITGTRKGMTERQKDMLAHLIAVCVPHQFYTFHDGDCVGVDIEARRMAWDWTYKLIVHPSTATTRAFLKLGGEEFREPKPPLVRNKDIVDECDLLVACPGGDHEELRSGTWACIRYGRKVKRRTIIIWPGGELSIYPEGYNGRERSEG